MTEDTDGRYAEETTLKSDGDLMVTIKGIEFPYCAFVGGQTFSDTTDLCIGDVIGFSPSDSEMDCDYVGDENNFTLHCEYESFFDEQTDCTFLNVADGTGSRNGDTFTYSVTWTITASGADCSGTCVITISGTSTRIGDAVCPSPKLSRRVSMPVMPEKLRP